MSYTFTKGTLCKSQTFEKDLSSKIIPWGPIIFDYNFDDSELVSDDGDELIFERKSEDGRIHHYYFKG